MLVEKKLFIKFWLLILNGGKKITKVYLHKFLNKEFSNASGKKIFFYSEFSLRKKSPLPCIIRYKRYEQKNLA